MDDGEVGRGRAAGSGAPSVVETREPGPIDVRAYIYLALMVLVGSSTAPAARYAVHGLPVGLIPLVRFGVAGLCLLPVIGRCGGDLGRLFREDGRRLVAAALCCVPLNQTFFLNATRLTSTSHVALIYGAVPMVVLLLAAALGQERLRADRLTGVVASMVGVALIGLDALWRGGAPTASSGSALGDLLLVGAVAAWGGYMTLSKPLINRHGALTVLAATFLLGAAFDAPLALATYRDWGSLARATPSAWWGMLYLTVVCTLVVLAFQNLALTRLDASQVATFGNVAPLLTVLWGVLLFGETVSPVLFLGGALILGGIVWTGRSGAAVRPPEKTLEPVALAALAPRRP